MLLSVVHKFIQSVKGKERNFIQFRNWILIVILIFLCKRRKDYLLGVFCFRVGGGSKVFFVKSNLFFIKPTIILSVLILSPQKFLFKIPKRWTSLVNITIALGGNCNKFNTRLQSYVCSGMIWFGLVWFYGISTIVGYLMPNPVFTYTFVLYIKYMTGKHIF